MSKTLYDDDQDQSESLLGGGKDLGYEDAGGAYDVPAGLGLGGDGIGVVGASTSSIGLGIGGGQDLSGTGISAAGGTVAMGEESSAGTMPRILLLGLKRSGKSSILKVVFNKMSPHETRHLESTKTPEKCTVATNSFIKFDVWDYPGQLEWEPEFDMTSVLEQTGAIIWVCDAQEEYEDSLTRFLHTVMIARAVNPNMQFVFFVHKVDGLSDDHKIQLYQNIISDYTASLRDQHMEEVQVEPHLTSIYDHSIFEAFSKVIQKMVPQLAVLESLLDNFNSISGLERTFLSDMATKIFLATDRSGGDQYKYDLCSDMMDLVTDVLSIYVASEEGEPPCIESEIRLGNGIVLYLYAVTPQLVLLCLIKESTFAKRGLLSYNFECLRKALVEILELQERDPEAVTEMMAQNTAAAYGFVPQTSPQASTFF